MADQHYAALADQLADLRTAIVCDCLAELGHEPAVMNDAIRPIHHSFRVAGFAATAHVVAVSAKPEDPTDNYRNELALVDGLGPGDVVVTSHARGAGFWGELLATAAKARGALGFVGDCPARDCEQLVAMNASTFTAGLNPLDSIGRLDIDQLAVDIECGGVTVSHGDLVVADVDGIVVVPRAIVDDLLPLVVQKAGREDVMRQDLAVGRPIGDAYVQHGVL